MKGLIYIYIIELNVYSSQMNETLKFGYRHLQNLYSFLNALLYMVINSFDEKYIIL